MALTPETQEARVSALMNAMAMKFCAQPETYAVFKKWCVRISAPAIADIFADMRPEYMEHYAELAAHRMLEAYEAAP